MVIIVQEPEILVYYCVEHNFDNPFTIAVYKGTTTRLLLCWSLYIGSGNDRLINF